MYKNIWIIGASAGIGEAIALEYASADTQLLLSARRKNLLEELAEKCKSKGAKSHVLPMDILDRDQFESWVSEAAQKLGNIDLVVFCAGVSQRARAEETQPQVAQKVMDIGYTGTAALAALILKRMISAKKGHFVVISSLTGLFGFPLRSAYAAAKHALHGYFESVQLENANNNIGVTMVCPGRVKTDISLNALDGKGQAHGKMDPGQSNGIEVDKAAQIIVKAAAKKKREVVIGSAGEKFLTGLHRYCRPLFFAIAQRIAPQ